MVNYNANFIGFQPIPKSLNPLRTDLYVSSSVTSGDACAAAAATSGNTETYDFTTAGTFYLYYSEDGGTTYRTFGPATIQGATAAATTEAEVAADINANAMIAKFITATDGAGVVLTSKALGPNVSFYVGGTANTALGFTEISAATEAAGTGTVATATLTITDPFGNPVPFAELDCNLYTGSTGTTADTSAQVNRATTGSIKSGAYTDDLEIITNNVGVCVLELADSTGGDVSTYLTLTDANGKEIDGGRVTVVVGQA